VRTPARHQSTPPGRHVGAPAIEICAALDVAGEDCDARKQRVVRHLDVREPCLSKLLRVGDETSASLELSTLDRAVCETLQKRRDAALVVEVAVESQALLVWPIAQIEAPQGVQRTAAEPESAGHHCRRDAAGAWEQPIQSDQNLLEGVEVPEVLEGHQQLEGELEVVLGGPVEACSHVVPLGQHDRKLERLVILLRQMGRSSDLEHPHGMVSLHIVCLARLQKPLRGELADRLEHPVALLVEATDTSADEALVEE
jgi:hypothetical protein